MGLVALSGFVLWLVSFPMAGFLLGSANFLPYFLLPHIVGFVLWFFVGERLLSLANVFTAVAALLTAVYPYVDSKELVMSAIGFFSSATAVLVGYRLQLGAVWAFLGLAVGNLLSFALSLAPFEGGVKYLVVSLGLLVLLLPLEEKVNAQKVEREFYRLLPFFFFFYLVGGVMYKGFMEFYGNVAYLSGVEVLFYVLGVLLSYALLKRYTQQALISLASVFLVISLPLFHMGGDVFLNAGMFSLQLGFGFADFFLILSLYSLRNPLRAYPLGFFAVCAGILTGYFVSLARYYGDFFIVFSYLALFLSVLYYFSQGGKAGEKVKESDPQKPEVRKTPKDFLRELEESIPDNKKKLSGRELEVLSMLLEGCSYEVVSERMGITTSSVREYARRGLEKLELSKEELCALYSKNFSPKSATLK
ncbi:MAG: helix-turn-helix transcriptional regulator [Hydrogenobacter thermophilus]|uniref:helix-turn-helix domain-containing protein n=1 Tax=Hydrogenobacter thermophilus TaxID=940 RepID=UPI001C77F2FA|nr:helix-turn-helix transcriptional regulator [Hydrogenobacter thermophilus]QWK19830.1 MAG: helix-turn-helix transcriptional regulator [Hydrogenobacter thermophilus]